MFAIGKILKPHGVRGEFKVLCYLDSPEMLLNIKKIIINDNFFSVEKILPIGSFFLMKINDFNNRDSVEKLRNLEIFCDEKNKPVLEEGRYYISNIIGCTIFDEKNNKLGIITDILQYGSADVVVFVNNEKKFLFPWLKELKVKVDLESKIFWVDSVKLKEVIVNEN